MRSLILSSAFFAFLFLTSAAQGSPVVVYSGNVATAVDGVVVNGVTYNVTFGEPPDSLFDGDATDATTAIDEIDAALNTTTAEYVTLQGCCSINQFIVEDAGTYNGILTTSYGAAGNWGNFDPTASGDTSVAEFTVAPAATPEPSSLALFGTGVLSLVGVARRRRFVGAA
jgi:hypothetical protein